MLTICHIYISFSLNREMREASHCRRRFDSDIGQFSKEDESIDLIPTTSYLPPAYKPHQSMKDHRQTSSNNQKARTPSSSPSPYLLARPNTWPRRKRLDSTSHPVRYRLQLINKYGCPQIKNQGAIALADITPVQSISIFNGTLYAINWKLEQWSLNGSLPRTCHPTTREQERHCRRDPDWRRLSFRIGR